MTRDYRIGNAVMEAEEWDHDLVIYRNRVEDVELPDAPLFDRDDLTKNSNFRSIAYGNNHRFLTKHHLDTVFDKFPEQGCIQLNNSILMLIVDARQRHEAKLGPYPPGFDDLQDADLARLMWFEWWMRWALDNCEFPAIEVW